MDEPSIHVKNVHDGSIAVVVVEGEHDLASRGELLAALDRAFTAAPSVIVDLSDATFIDSSVLSVIAAAGRNPGRSLGLIAPRPRTPASRLLDVTDARAMFSVVPSVEEPAG